MVHVQTIACKIISEQSFRISELVKRNSCNFVEVREKLQNYVNPASLGIGENYTFMTRRKITQTNSDSQNGTGEFVMTV